MGAELARLGTYPKKDGEEVYYVNRLDHAFSIKVYGNDGNPLIKKNPATGQDLFDSFGQPQYIEKTVKFIRWHTKFTDLGYWCIYLVTPETPRDIAEELLRQSKSKDHQTMTEKAFIEMTNPDLAQHMERTLKLNKEHEKLSKEVEDARNEKSRLDQEIARLKQKAGIK